MADVTAPRQRGTTVHDIDDKCMIAIDYKYIVSESPVVVRHMLEASACSSAGITNGGVDKGLTPTILTARSSTLFLYTKLTWAHRSAHSPAPPKASGPS